MPGKRYTNKEIIEKLQNIEDKLANSEKEGEKAKSLTFIAIGIALIAITVPLIVKLTLMPEYGQWAIVIVYFGLGLYFIFSEYTKIKNLK